MPERHATLHGGQHDEQACGGHGRGERVDGAVLLRAVAGEACEVQRGGLVVG